jgi:hypothetical protein
MMGASANADHESGWSSTIPPKQFRSDVITEGILDFDTPRDPEGGVSRPSGAGSASRTGLQ